MKIEQLESDQPDMTPARTDAIRRSLLSTIRDEPRARVNRIRKRFAIWGGVGLLVVGGASVAGAVVLQASTVTNQNIVHCLRSAERGADGSYEESSASISATNGTDGRVHDAVALCSEMWRQGVLSPSFDALKPTNPPGTVPADLRVCVMSDGSAAVVPGGPNVCAALGLAPLSH